jgi:hypothetical protein
VPLVLRRFFLCRPVACPHASMSRHVITVAGKASINAFALSLTHSVAFLPAACSSFVSSLPSRSVVHPPASLCHRRAKSSTIYLCFVANIHSVVVSCSLMSFCVTDTATTFFRSGFQLVNLSFGHHLAFGNSCNALVFRVYSHR